MAQCPNSQKTCLLLHTDALQRCAGAARSRPSAGGQTDTLIARKTGIYASDALSPIASRLGATPNAREYSRLNCDALS